MEPPESSIAPTNPSMALALAPFATPQRLSVRQRKRWLEILTSFDARNTYLVYDEANNPIVQVQEGGTGFGSVLKRLILAAYRPFTATVTDLGKSTDVLTLRRPFRFIFHRLEVRTTDGQLIGALQKRWTWFRRKYTVENAQGQEIATLFGPFWRPWTFKIQVPDSATELGLIQKKWSGLGKEMFTQADNFWIELDRVQDPQLRTLLFASTVLIDVVHFERS